MQQAAQIQHKSHTGAEGAFVAIQSRKVVNETPISCAFAFAACAVAKMKLSRN